MKKINYVKIILDLVMTVIFFFMFNKMIFGGISFHERAGLIIGILFLVHKILNIKWLKQVSLNLFNKNVKFKTKLSYIVDVLLLISMVYIIISGVIISKVLFPNLKLSNEMIFKTTHISVSYISLLLVGIHLGLHWDWVMNTMKRMLRIRQGKAPLKALCKILVVIVLVIGGYNIYKTNYFGRVSMITNSINRTQGQGIGKGNGGNINSNGNKNERHNFQEGQHGEIGKNKGNGMISKVNPLNVLFQNVGIVGIFTIFTYYIGKMLKRKAVNKMIV